MKNLPANTEESEIKPLFERHGHIARFLMPQHGITALVDYIEPFEAKKAFSKLAYSQFKSSPLYLEWAPENVFVKPAERAEADDNKSDEKAEIDNNEPSKHTLNKIESTKEVATSQKEETTQQQPQDTKDSVKEPEPLGDPENDTTLFVKNLNFITTEEDLKRVSCDIIEAVKMVDFEAHILSTKPRRMHAYRPRLRMKETTLYKKDFSLIPKVFHVL